MYRRKRRLQDKPLAGFTKKQLLTAALLILDETVGEIECKIIQQEGNLYCRTEYKNGVKWNNCSNCMLNQYLERAKSGEQSKYDIMLQKVKQQNP